MQSNTDGSNIIPFFLDHLRDKRSIDQEECNCPLLPSIGKTFTIDHSDRENKFKLFYLDTNSSSVIEADHNSCQCQITLNVTSQNLETLKSDFNRLYWTNSIDDYLYIFDKRSNKIETILQRNAGDFLIYGRHTQPYPQEKCLIPKFNENLTVSLVTRLSNSLILGMPDIEIEEECRNISTATVEYRIYYMPYNSEDDVQCDETCAQISTFSKEMIVKGLRPFSEYVFSLDVSNYYSNNGRNGQKHHIGPGTVIKTAVGGECRLVFDVGVYGDD